jgi:luciferase-like monooxygenase
VLGALSEATERLELATGVTCPTTRIHPAIVAQAAATAALQLPGRFSLGVGSGENLNEHVLGDRWPSVAERRNRPIWRRWPATAWSGPPPSPRRSSAFARAAARGKPLEWWPNGAVSGSYFLELPLPSHFEQAAELVGEEEVPRFA